ncbi:hypothetical protein ACOXH8_31930, partial [Nannocystis pusilla]
CAGGEREASVRRPGLAAEQTPFHEPGGVRSSETIARGARGETMVIPVTVLGVSAVIGMMGARSGTGRAPFGLFDVPASSILSRMHSEDHVPVTLDELSAAFPWPEATAQAFPAVGPSPELGAVAAGGWWGHAFNYKDAADFLVEGLITQRFEMESIGPILFLYRHYIELSLKAMAHQVATRDEVRKAGHDLKSVWKIICDACDYQPSDPELAGVAALIEEWSKMDALSFAFRYPTTKAGTPSLHPDLPTFVNIRSIAQSMTELGNAFSVIDAHIDGMMAEP